MSATALRSIGDTIFFGIYDFDFHPDGSLIVTDKLDYKVKHISGTEKILNEIGKKGRNKGEFFTGPFLCAVGKSHIAIADYSSPRIQIFTRTLQYISEFRVNGIVIDMEFDSKENLWIGTITDSKETTRLLLCDEKGKTKNEYSLVHANDNIFDNLYFFTITQRDTIFVAYAYQNIIEKYFNDYIEFFSLPISTKAKIPYKYHISEKENNFKVPEGEIIYSLCADKQDYLYLLAGDYAFNLFRDVYILNSKGEIIAMLSLPVESKKSQLMNNATYGVLSIIEQCSLNIN